MEILNRTPKNNLISLLLMLALGFSACQTASQTEVEAEAWPLQMTESPASLQSGEPNLFAAKDGSLFLSWIDEEDENEYALRFSTWKEDSWSAAQTIAQDSGWFVNWADFPSLAAQGDFMASHWLAKSGEGTFDYDVKVSISEDEGQNWSEPFTLHRDGIPAEHGFVTMLPVQDEEMFAVWLDGRQTKMDDTHDHTAHEHGGGAMTLHATTFKSDGSLGQEMALDMRICDCCQTDAVLTEEGVLVVYRDRSEEEVRDIFYTLQINKQWTRPAPVYSDQWQIEGCPVNGPSAASLENQVAVAWFTSANEQPKVQLVLSDNNGASFSEPVQLDHGNPAGRVDVVYLDDNHLMVSWMERTMSVAVVRAALLDQQGNVLGDRQLVPISDARSSGFPIMERAGDQVFIAWTEVGEEQTQVKTAYVSMHEILEKI